MSHVGAGRRDTGDCSIDPSFLDRMARDQARLRLRTLGAAPFVRVRAARMKRASMGRIERIRHFAGDGCARRAGHREIGHCSEQHSRVRMLGIAEELPCGCKLDDASEVHDADAVSDVMDDGEVV